MGMAPQDDWSGLVDGTAIERPLAVRIAAGLRSLCTPSTLALVGIIALSWLALIGWTGAGPDSWQARSCAGLDLPPASCNSVQLRKDQSRIAPHGTVIGASS